MKTTCDRHDVKRVQTVMLYVWYTLATKSKGRSTFGRQKSPTFVSGGDICLSSPCSYRWRLFIDKRSQNQLMIYKSFTSLGPGPGSSYPGRCVSSPLTMD